MNINKSHWYSNGDHVRLQVPFAKVDKERRLVSGFATLDNVDRQKDIVTSDAASKAFETFRGNIREMHQPIAVGKLVSFRQDQYFDPETQKFYTGIYVDAYVSKGASDTWEKVLDGTLSGFSIGGVVNDAEKVYDSELQDTIQVIKDMELYELSLVDNPANQLANVFTIEKTADGVKMSGMSTDVRLENVFYCSVCKVASTSPKEVNECIVCDSAMEKIGWVESVEKSILSEDVKEIIDRYLEKVSGLKKSQEKDPLSEPMQAVQTDNTISKGGNSVENEVTVEETVEETVEKAVAEEAVEAVEEASVDAADVVVEKSADEEEEAAEVVADAEEVVEKAVNEEEASESDESVVLKALDDFKTSIIEALSTQAATSATATQEAIASVEKNTDDKVSALQAELSKAVAEITEAVVAVAKRVEEVESATAMKKSGDLGGSSESITKSVWGGRFLSASSLVEE